MNNRNQTKPNFRQFGYSVTYSPTLSASYFTPNSISYHCTFDYFQHVSNILTKLQLEFGSVWFSSVQRNRTSTLLSDLKKIRLQSMKKFSNIIWNPIKCNLLIRVLCASKCGCWQILFGWYDAYSGVYFVHTSFTVHVIRLTGFFFLQCVCLCYCLDTQNCIRWTTLVFWVWHRFSALKWEVKNRSKK